MKMQLGTPYDDQKHKISSSISGSVKPLSANPTKTILWGWCFKGCVRYISASLFFKSKQKPLSNQEKCFFISLQKLFSFSRKSNFSILDFQISLRHQVNNLGSVHDLLMKFGQFMSYSKRKNSSKKFYKKCGMKTSSRPFCVCK